MTKQQFNLATQIVRQMELIENQLVQLSQLDLKKGVDIMVEVEGFRMKIPRAKFKNDLVSKQVDLQAQLTALQNEFDTL